MLSSSDSQPWILTIKSGASAKTEANRSIVCFDSFAVALALAFELGMPCDFPFGTGGAFGIVMASSSVIKPVPPSSASSLCTSSVTSSSAGGLPGGVVGCASFLAHFRPCGPSTDTQRLQHRLSSHVTWYPHPDVHARTFSALGLTSGIGSFWMCARIVPFGLGISFESIVQ